MQIRVLPRISAFTRSNQRAGARTLMNEIHYFQSKGFGVVQAVCPKSKLMEFSVGYNKLEWMSMEFNLLSVGFLLNRRKGKLPPDFEYLFILI
jgi:hypothetical protein